MNSIELVYAIDPCFVMPLAVAVRSLLDHCTGDWKVNVYVISDPLSEKTKQKLLRSWNSDRLYKVAWISANRKRIKRLVSVGHLAKSTYYRLMIGELLPNTIQKAIYVDSDIVATANITELWQIDLCGYTIAAVGETDFNAGVLLIDLCRWRENLTGDKTIQWLLKNPDKNLTADQDALNHVFKNSWLRMDPKWNMPQWQLKAETKDAGFEGLIHYIGGTKPWHHHYQGKGRSFFFHYLDRTEWAGWRPRKTFTAMILADLRQQILSKFSTVLRRESFLFKKLSDIYYGISRFLKL
jgi:lipopolysaccharide biosynthesis glycosyltransferase